MKIYQAIPHYIQAIENCIKSGREEWQERHEIALRNIMDTAPSGSGFDAGTHINEGNTTADKLVFNVPFHHMNANGYYDGWTEHKVVITPSFMNFDIKVTGINKDNIKEYITGVFIEWLLQDC